MQTFNDEIQAISLVSWARTHRPINLGSLFRSKVTTQRTAQPATQPTTGATDNILFGFSTLAFILIPLVALIVVAFG